MENYGIMNELAGKRALVTGGTYGIGAGIAQRLIDGGASVVIAARSESPSAPARAKFVGGDVTSVAGAHAIAEAALDILGGIDIVVNNAGGTDVYPAGVSAIEDDQWQAALDLNYLSAVRLNSRLVPEMVAQGSGAIIHISTAPARAPLAFLLHYAAAKAALATYSKGLAVDLAPKGVRVNTVTPGLVESPGSDPLRQKVAAAAGFDPAMMISGIPLGRAGQPADIGEAVAFLVSARAAYVTGVDLVVDGGLNPAV
ncbi:NAD(P)-dependent dehydrogenase (short-subunit alcohol dehydrogenase family) [Micromonospora pisi]|uniref:NAD(P)-dependent dehydrogenase (Short-subunit alcohol dehydrogenase family) n=1 Tax=Micromonospora pisi TaxID=589240 RepID=A0A495JUK8_9ACTN|nr:oxidoreductase [Micromonospora pisi]RKR91809.1 NAD(P)-dependent dehydrogenase (short-subunit alcohol dehydrogenase family) [Micromonospora pisi]